MKTTVDISDTLFNAVKKLASQQGTTVRALIEEGLRHVLSVHQHPKPFRLRKATFKGRGLQSHLKGASWEQIRELIYESPERTPSRSTRQTD
ncbi:MAG: DUF2191 domain-containing protein [Nitrospirae bacterium]|nr:MAG: DUF2191 domain-containing protein [Nitrospirota bacterium]